MILQKHITLFIHIIILIFLFFFETKMQKLKFENRNFKEAIKFKDYFQKQSDQWEI